MVGPSISFPFPENFIDDELIFRLSLLLLFSSRSRVKFAKLEFRAMFNRHTACLEGSREFDETSRCKVWRDAQQDRRVSRNESSSMEFLIRALLSEIYVILSVSMRRRNEDGDRERGRGKGKKKNCRPVQYRFSRWIPAPVMFSRHTNATVAAELVFKLEISSRDLDIIKNFTSLFPILQRVLFSRPLEKLSGPTGNIAKYCEILEFSQFPSQ